MIKLISTEDKIELISPKEIVLTAGGSQLKINASGVFSTTGGKFESKAGQHSFVGGENIVSSKVSQRNEKAIARLHPQVRGLIRKFINNVYTKHQVQLVIVQDYRTYAQQDALYAKGRTAFGDIVTNAKGGQSNHNFALAVDVFPLWEDGKLHMDAKSDAINIKILKKIAPVGKSIGLEWGEIGNQ